MAFVFRAAGTSAVGSNVTSLTPGLPAGTAAGDLLVIQFQNFGGTNSRVPSVDGTWDSYVWTNGTANHLVAWKIAGASESAPTVTLTGTGSASDTQLARVHGFNSDASLAITLAVAGTNSTNSSADNIGPITGVTVPTGGGLNLITAGKTNDFNGQGSLTNYTQAALTESTTGNDAGMTLMYRLDTPAGATGNLTVTDNGGTASAGLGFGKMLTFVETANDLIDIELLEGTTVIESWIDQEITTSIADLNLTVTPAALATITDLNALRIQATKVGSAGYIRIYEFAVAITGTESGGGTAYTLTAAVGAFAVAGQAATLKAARLMAAAVGVFLASGQAANFRVSRASSAGAFTLTGQDATLKAGNSLTAAVGAFVLTGQSASFRVTRVMSGAVGSFTLTGQPATLRRGKSLISGVGDFALAGQSASLRLQRILTASVGSFALTGKDATLMAGKSLTGGVGAFALTGQSAALRFQRVLTASVGSFALTGKDAILLKGKVLIAEAGAFTLTGQAATFLAGISQLGRHQIALFPNPVNAAGPIDANIVRSNDNITAVAYNAHDADAAIHVRSGPLAVRPATATEGSVYIGTDTLFMYIYTSGAWNRVL